MSRDVVAGPSAAIPGSRDGILIWVDTSSDAVGAVRVASGVGCSVGHDPQQVSRATASAPTAAVSDEGVSS
jgi:hypothetical protein